MSAAEAMNDSSGPSAADILNALLTAEGRADPYPLYAAAHRLGPVIEIADGFLMVTGYDAVNEVLRNPGFGLPDPAPPMAADADSPLGPNEPDTASSDALRSMNRSILRANPPDHGRMRSLISQAFTPRRVSALRPAIRRAVELLVEKLQQAAAGAGTVDFMEHFAFQLPVTVICDLLGVQVGDHDRFRPLASDLTEALELTGDLSEAADAAAGELQSYFTVLVADRRAHPADDLIGALVAARDADGGRLSETELLANLILLLVAGFETTTSLLGNGLAVLLDTPGLADAMREDRVRVEAFVEEVLRFDSPVQATTRLARAEGLSVAGVPVPRGCQLILLVGAANRDPRRYDDPDRFDPSREGVKPLSFGAGAHICLGNALARLEAVTAFRTIVDRLPGITAAATAPTRRDRLVLRGLQTLPVRIVAQSSAG